MAQRLAIKDMQEIALSKSGKCLSKEYINSTSQLEWMCQRGHTWDMPYSVVQQGGWCEQCAKNDKWIENVRELAEENGGIYLSDIYVKGRTPIKFQCDKGHKFLLSLSSLKNGSWCRLCYKQKQKEEALNRLIKIIKKKAVLTFPLTMKINSRLSNSSAIKVINGQ